MLTKHNGTLTETLNQLINKYGTNRQIKAYLKDKFIERSLSSSYPIKILSKRLELEALDILNIKDLFVLYVFTEGLQEALLLKDRNNENIGLTNEIVSLDVNNYFTATEISIFSKYTYKDNVAEKGNNYTATMSSKVNSDKDVKICKNGLVALEDRKFNIDDNIKEDFLKTLTPNTAKTMRGILLKVDEFESLINKSVYKFDSKEVNELIDNEFSRKSIATVRSSISYLKRYINYCISKNFTNVNLINNITDASQYVDKNAMQNKYLTKEELTEIQSKLANFNDRCMLELLFEGVKPEELVNLKESDINFKGKYIVVTDKKDNMRQIFGLTDRCFELLKLTISQKSYYLNNGSAQSRKNPNKIFNNGLGVRTLPFAESEYVFKTAGSKNVNKPMAQSGLQARVRVIREWVGNSYITVTNLYYSGILHEAHTIMEQTNVKELDRFTVARLADKYNYCQGFVMDKNTGHLVVNSRVGSLQELIKEGIANLYLK